MSSIRWIIYFNYYNNGTFCKNFFSH